MRSIFNHPLVGKIIELIFILFAIAPSFIYSYKTYEDPWSISRLRRADASLPEGIIQEYRTALSGYRDEHIGGEIVNAGLISVSQWPIDWLVLVPIGSILVLSSYYAISRVFSTSKVSTLALVIYAGWYYPRLGNQYGLQTYAWTNALFIGFLILCFFWMRYRNPVYSALIFIVFITTFFFYPTTPLWMFSIMVFTAAALKLRNWLASERVNYSWSIPLFMLVFYFTFDTAFYGNFLNRVKSEISGETLVSSFLSRIIAPIIIDKNLE